MDQGPLPNRRLRLQRRLRGWSQDDVAAGLCRIASGRGEPDLGVDATMISRWERGTRHPRPRYVRLLCQLFDLPVEQLGLVRDADLDVVPTLAMERIEGDACERGRFLREMAQPTAACGELVQNQIRPSAEMLGQISAQPSSPPLSSAASWVALVWA